MPIYLFQHPSSKEVIEIKQRISDRHEYIDEHGVMWNRIFTVPYTSVPNMTRIDATSEQEFMKKTQDFQGNMGDLFDASKDLSEKRKEIMGNDPVQQKFYKKYSKDRKGLKHTSDTSHLDSKYKPNSDGVIEI
jgi:hypothetical protein